MNNELPHLEVNQLSEKTKSSMKTRTIVALGMLVTLIPAIFLGGWVFFFLLAIFLAFAVYEMITSTKKKYPWWIWVFTYLVVYSYVYWFVVKANILQYQISKETGTAFVFSLENYYSGIVISPISVAVAIGVYCFCAVVSEKFDFADVAYFIFFTLLLGLGFQCFFFLRYYPFYLYSHNSAYSSLIWVNNRTGADLPSLWQFNYFWSVALIFNMLITATLSDVFAYFGGVFFGKHKMNPRISPNKTWEGFFFGIIGGTAVSFAFSMILAATGFPMLPTLTVSNWYWILLLSVVGTLAGVLGDLSFSMVKRHYGVKDFGKLFPGHGGVVDRIDSDLFSAIAMSVILIFITNSWNFAL